MMQLLQLMFEIAILRRGPQDLPASNLLAWLVTLAYVVGSAVQSVLRGWDAPTTMVLLILDVGVQTLWLWGLLMFFAKRARFLQTYSAFMGVNALLVVLDLVVTGVQGLLGQQMTDASNPWHLVSLCLMLLSLGGVLQHALEKSLFMCMALTFSIMLTVAYVAQISVPGM